MKEVDIINYVQWEQKEAMDACELLSYNFQRKAEVYILYLHKFFHVWPSLSTGDERMKIIRLIKVKEQFILEEFSIYHRSNGRRKPTSSDNTSMVEEHRMASAIFIKSTTII